MNLVIAGIKISIRHPGINLLEESDRTYTAFMAPDSDQTDGCDMEIFLESGPIPRTSEMRLLFDTGQTWSMYHDGEKYFLSIGSPPGNRRPVCLARFNTECSSVHIFCDDGLMIKGKQNDAILNPFCFPLDRILLMYHLAYRGGMFVHAAGGVAGQAGYIFPGRSGAGKSTLAENMAAGRNIKIYSDERVAVRDDDGITFFYGTPWAGDAGVAENRRAPLKGIFFIRQGGKNAVREIDREASLRMLLPVISVPWYDEKTMSGILRYCEKVLSMVPSHEFILTQDIEAVRYLERFIGRL